MLHCHSKMELIVPVFSTLGIYRAAATDVLIKTEQTLMSNILHTVLDLIQFLLTLRYKPLKANLQ